MSNRPWIRYDVIFRGDVQGVGFRANAIMQARGLDVRGFVQNEPDGSVRMDVVGLKADLEELINRIRASMEGNIEDVQLEVLAPEKRSPGFRIGRGW